MSRTTSWIFLFLPIMGLKFGSSGGEKHSLMNAYTGFSKDPGLPGLHRFTVVGSLDGKTVRYFDSNTRMKEPRQDWMKDRLPVAYWVQKTEICISKDQLFQYIIQTLKDRLRQNDDDMHVLQRIHGCEATLTDGRPTFSRIIERYSYDGRSLMHFDETNGRWVADMEEAQETVRNWNEEPGMKYRVEDYLHNRCLPDMLRFLDFEKEQLETAPPPDVFLFSTKIRVSSNVLLLICFATGFYPEDVELNIRRDGRVLTAVDGLTSTGTRPNGDGTFQRRDSVEILRTDTATYSCEVNHRASKVHVTRQWDGGLPDDPNWGLIVAVGVVVLLVLVVVIIVVVVIKVLGPYNI